MLKPVIAATALIALAGSSYVYAQQGFGGRGFGYGGQRGEYQHHRLTANDVNAFADARIAALKAGLELTPDQAKNWPAFESALRNMVQLRIQRMQARQAARQQDQSQGQNQPQGQNQTPGQNQAQGQTEPQTSAGPFGRLARRADAMTKRAAALKQIADTGAPLYASLTDEQKTRFTMLARILRPHHRAFAGGNWREGYGRDGRGDDGYRHGFDGRRFGQDGPRFGRDGQRFGQDGRGWGRGDRQFGEDGRGPFGMHRMMQDDGDQDSL